jgi:hypothetical protein
MARNVSAGRLSSVQVSEPSDFYRQEFLKHRECLKRQREYFSEGAISTADEALARVLNQLEQLCKSDNADQLIADLLRKFNAVTNLSAWSDPRQLH